VACVERRGAEQSAHGEMKRTRTAGPMRNRVHPVEGTGTALRGSGVRSSVERIVMDASYSSTIDSGPGTLYTFEKG
jgi:hypothetical protein